MTVRISLKPFRAGYRMPFGLGMYFNGPLLAEGGHSLVGLHLHETFSVCYRKSFGLGMYFNGSLLAEGRHSFYC